jgi:hypothetical protein
MSAFTRHGRRPCGIIEAAQQAPSVRSASWSQ